MIKLKDIELYKDESILSISFYLKDKDEDFVYKEILNFYPMQTIKSMITAILRFIKDLTYDYWNK